MLNFLPKASLCWQSANPVVGLFKKQRSLLLLKLSNKAGMGENIQNVAQKGNERVIQTKPKVFVTRPDFPQNGIDLLVKK